MASQADLFYSEMPGAGSLADKELARLYAKTGLSKGTLADLYVAAGEYPRLIKGNYSKPYGLSTVNGKTTVTDGVGTLAVLTYGAKTVVMRGPQRTFTENKKLFKDDFTRTTTNGFGISPGGGNWSNTTGADAIFSCNGTNGVIALDVANSSRYATLLDNNIADVDVVTRFTMDELPVGNAASLGLVIGYTDPNNNYRGRLSISTTGIVQLTLEKEVAGVVTALGALTQVGTGWVPGQVWLIRMKRTGTTIQTRAWLDGSGEPGTWLHTVVDTDLGAGRVGFRALASSGNTNIPFNYTIDYIDVQAGSWAVPTTVTHTSWVRVLQTPYAGWNSSVAAQIDAWTGSNAPDVLEYAMRFIAGAPTVMNGSVKIGGQANYGPLNADGTLQEGADFHEYMGIPWTFDSSGETRPANTAQWQNCLDCSGFVRMVYGYYMGIPMVVSKNYNGLTLPRVTANIALYGPGVVVASSPSAPPALTDLQIGDIVNFDADSSDPGVIDHSGIYIGDDGNGFKRFINSRKTPNGPTFSDLGGASRIDGAGLYATSLRLIRRF